MADPTTARFPCPACGKTYRWKEELAGRKVKCTCGHIMVAPKDASGAYVADDLIPLAGESQAAHTVAGEQIMAATAVGAPALAPTTATGKAPSPKPRGASKSGRCPSCNASLPTGAVVCVACGMNLQTGQKLSTVGAASEGAGGSARPVVHVNRGQLLGSHPPKPPPAKSNRTPLLLAALLLLAAAVVWFFLQN
ncbi:MAG: zinc-ribbon domain-containing protein [Phycisphaerae bacterium]|nr:zinc-ribbon domain-containing protein [Phycisphaerae bacterium]